MKRITILVLVVALMTALTAATAMAAPKQGAGCKGLLNAIAKQTQNRPGGANPVLVQKATERGCIVTAPVETAPTE